MYIDRYTYICIYTYIDFTPSLSPFVFLSLSPLLSVIYMGIHIYIWISNTSIQTYSTTRMHMCICIYTNTATYIKTYENRNLKTFAHAEVRSMCVDT